MTILSSDYPRIMLGISSNRLFLAEPIEGFSAEILNFKISSLAHYLLELDDGSWCSAHCAGRFGAGAISGKVL